MKHPKPPFWMHPHLALLHWFEQQEPAPMQNDPSAWHAPHWLLSQFPEQHAAFPSPHATPFALQAAGPQVPPALQSFWQQSLLCEQASPLFLQVLPLELLLALVVLLVLVLVELLVLVLVELLVLVLLVELLALVELLVLVLVELVELVLLAELLALVVLLLVPALPPAAPPAPEDDEAAVVAAPPGDPANRLSSTPPHPGAAVAALSSAVQRAARMAKPRERRAGGDELGMRAWREYADRGLAVIVRVPGRLQNGWTKTRRWEKMRRSPCPRSPRSPRAPRARCRPPRPSSAPGLWSQILAPGHWSWCGCCSSSPFRRTG